MTIIEPHKSKRSYNFKVVLLFSLLGFLAYLNIYFYNENVGLRHDIQSQSKNLQNLQVINAESKDQLYKITDLTNLNVLLKDKNLVKDQKPEYLEVSSALAVN